MPPVTPMDAPQLGDQQPSTLSFQANSGAPGPANADDLVGSQVEQHLNQIQSQGFAGLLEEADAAAQQIGWLGRAAEGTSSTLNSQKLPHFGPSNDRRSRILSRHLEAKVAAFLAMQGAEQVRVVQNRCREPC